MLFRSTQNAIYEIGRPWTGDLEHTLRWELTRTARIVNGRLLLRTEHKAIPRIAESVTEDERAYTLLSTCVHWHWHFKRNSEFLAISRLLDAVRAYAGMEVRSEVTPCRFCCTEFEARGRRLLDGRVVLDFVVWQDLGGLEGVRPDRRWEGIVKYVVVPMESVVEGYLHDYTPEFEAGSIKRCFR